MCAESVHEAWGREELEPRLAKEVFEMKTPEEIKAIKLALMDIETTCGHCPYEGEPNGCNRPGGTCKMFDVAMDAAEAIQQLEAQQPRWISVGERLPGKNGEYLCFFEDEQIASAEFCKEEGGFGWREEYFDIDTMSVTDSEWRNFTVTHWMPLPQSPEEE